MKIEKPATVAEAVAAQNPQFVQMTKEELQALLTATANQAATQAVSSVQSSQAQAQPAVQAAAAQAAPAPAPAPAPVDKDALITSLQGVIAEKEAQLKEATRPRTLEEFDRLYTGMSEDRQLTFRKANGLLDAGFIRDFPGIRTFREFKYGHHMAGAVHAAEEGALIAGGVLALLGKLRLG